jgi:hypothetical protein
MELFSGDLPMVMVLAVYASAASLETPDEFHNLSPAQIHKELRGWISEESIQLCRRSLITLGVLETDKGTDTACRINGLTIRRLVADPKESRTWIAAKLGGAQ